MEFVSYNNYIKDIYINETVKQINIIHDDLNEGKISKFLKTATLIGSLLYNVYGINEPAERKSLSKEVAKEITTKTNKEDLLNKTEKELQNYNYNLSKYEIFKFNKNLIKNLKQINPNRFSESKIKLYNKYDEQILQACSDLRKQGYNPNPNVIKTFLAIETGFRPRKNSKGFFGYPQTKKVFIDEVNKKFHQNFTPKDMYDIYQSAKFIFFRLKLNSKSKHVDTNDLADLIMSYNWGIGNTAKYKSKQKDLPDETKEYIDFGKTIEKHVAQPFKLES